MLDTRYIPLYTLSEGSILDKSTGAPLTDGIVSFYRDSQRNEYKPVYQLAGTSPNYTFIPLSQPLTLSAIGTFVDSMGNPVVPYLYPYDDAGSPDLYYATVYSSLDGITPAVFQFDVEAIPYLKTSSSPGGGGGTFENELSNPQFSSVDFYPSSTPYVYTISGPGESAIDIAKDWTVYVVGAGTVTVTQVPLQPSSFVAGIPSNPPYALDINSTGFTDANIRLVQRFNGNSALFTNGALSGYFIARSMDSAAHPLQMLFNQSNGTPSDTQIITGSTTSGGLWVEFQGSVLLPLSTNPDVAPTGYTEVSVVIPVAAHIQITSLQVIGTATILTTDSNVFDQQPIARQVDHLFHDYLSPLSTKPIPSYVTGWDFRMNPCQHLGRTVPAAALGANKSRYIADQTIAFEAVSNVLSYQFNQNATALRVMTTGTTQFAIIQYLEPPICNELFLNRFCAQLKGKVSSGTVTGTVNFYWTTDASLPVLAPLSGQGNSLVSTMAAGVPTTGNGTWNQVPRGFFNAATFTFNTNYQTLDFSYWDASLTAAPATATFMAVVIGFNAITSSQIVDIDYVTVNSGDIPSRPPPLSPAQTLAALQTYYETSWDPGFVGTLTESGSRIFLMDWNINGSNTDCYAQPFSLFYGTEKRFAATPVLFSTRTTLVDNDITAYVRVASSETHASVPVGSYWDAFPSLKSTLYVVNNITALNSVASGAGTYKGAYINLHYICDARLGVV